MNSENLETSRQTAKEFRIHVNNLSKDVFIRCSK